MCVVEDISTGQNLSSKVRLLGVPRLEYFVPSIQEMNCVVSQIYMAVVPVSGLSA